MCPLAYLSIIMYANIYLFHFRIIYKYFILRKFLFSDFLQIVLSRSRMLHSHRSEYLSTHGGKNYVRYQSLFVCEHCFCLLTLFPMGTQLSHGCLNIRVANFKGLQPPEGKKAQTSYLHEPQQEPCKSCRTRENRFQNNAKQIDFMCNFKNRPSLLCLKCCIEEAFLQTVLKLYRTLMNDF